MYGICKLLLPYIVSSYRIHKSFKIYKSITVQNILKKRTLFVISDEIKFLNYLCNKQSPSLLLQQIFAKDKFVKVSSGKKWEFLAEARNFSADENCFFIE